MFSIHVFTFLNSGLDRIIIFFLHSNGVEEPMDEPAPEPEPEPEPEAKVEDVKPEADEKVLEEMEEKAPSPAPVESPPNAQEPPKVKKVGSVVSCPQKMISQRPQTWIQWIFIYPNQNYSSVTYFRRICHYSGHFM